MRSRHPLFQILCFVLAIFVSSFARADHMSGPVGAVILTIKGDMSQSNIPGGAVFDLDMLKKIGTVSFSTSTPWTTGVQYFTGVPLNQLLVHLGAKPVTLTVSALNDYQIEVPAADAVDGGPMLAWEQDGRGLSVREKGPLWLIYPFDSKKDYQTDQIYSRAVWQVVQIDLMP